MTVLLDAGANVNAATPDGVTGVEIVKPNVSVRKAKLTTG
jgi:hypothetical protein